MFFGHKYSVDKNLTLILENGKKIEKNDMLKLVDHYKGVNKIHKPIALLFWTDVKNGKTSNWKLIENDQISFDFQPY